MLPLRWTTKPSPKEVTRLVYAVFAPTVAPARST
jgi:hypothetical protein